MNRGTLSVWGAHAAANSPRRPESSCNAVTTDQFAPWFVLSVASSSSGVAPVSNNLSTTQAQSRTNGKSNGALERARAIFFSRAGLGEVMTPLYRSNCDRRKLSQACCRPLRGTMARPRIKPNFRMSNTMKLSAPQANLMGKLRAGATAKLVGGRWKIEDGQKWRTLHPAMIESLIAGNLVCRGLDGRLQLEEASPA